MKDRVLSAVSDAQRFLGAELQLLGGSRDATRDSGYIGGGMATTIDKVRIVVVGDSGE